MVASFKRYRLVLISAGLAVAVVVAKFVVHALGLEGITVNPLFSGMVAANVFLMGFLLSGVLTDYKESEKLPGELAACLESLSDDFVALKDPKQQDVRKDGLAQILRLGTAIHAWLFQRQPTQQTMVQVSELVHVIARIEPFIPANYTVRLKQEQNNLRRCLIRITTIRETSFILAGYVISGIFTVALTAGLVFVRMDKVPESLFLVGLITFLFAFLSLLIRDLDNPFGYSDQSSAEDVSIKPLLDALARLKDLQVP